MEWQTRTGRDQEGDKFVESYLIGEGGRILVVVEHPQTDEVIFTALIGGRRRSIYEAEFIDLESAKAYGEAQAPHLLFLENEHRDERLKKMKAISEQS